MRVASNPGEGLVECPGLESGRAERAIEHRGADAEVTESDGIAIKTAGDKGGEESHGDENTRECVCGRGWGIRAEKQENGATECREGEDEAVE